MFEYDDLTFDLFIKLNVWDNSVSFIKSLLSVCSRIFLLLYFV